MEHQQIDGGHVMVVVIASISTQAVGIRDLFLNVRTEINVSGVSASPAPASGPEVTKLCVVVKFRVNCQMYTLAAST